MSALLVQNNSVYKNEPVFQNVYPVQIDIPEIRFLTREEQLKLHHTSYQYRYGCFVRLALYTGIRLCELLALQWEDMDLCSQQLFIRRSLYRVPTKGRPGGIKEKETKLVIQAPKSSISIRRIPLFPAAIQDLMQWREVQWKERMEAGELYQDRGLVASDPHGNCVDPTELAKQCAQMGAAAGIGYITFHVLRTTFAVRAIEQGWNDQVLSMIMGHSTVNNYPYVLSGPGYASQMEELFAIGQNYDRERVYTVVLTPLGNGRYDFHSPDFPEIFPFHGSDVQQGLLYMKECLEDEILTYPFPKEPEQMDAYSQQLGELCLHILV